jgi:hypothetical protein
VTYVRKALDGLWALREKPPADVAMDVAMAAAGAYVWVLARWRAALAALIVTGATVAIWTASTAPDPKAADSGVPLVRVPSPPASGTSPASSAIQPVTSSAVTTPLSGRASITRALQSKLQRAGCYDGQVNGYWTARSKDAMARFVDRLNAKLPVEQPDEVLLALMENNPRASCSAEMPVAPSPAPAPVEAAVSSPPGIPPAPASPIPVSAAAVVAPAIVAATARNEPARPPAAPASPPQATAPLPQSPLAFAPRGMLTPSAETAQAAKSKSEPSESVRPAKATAEPSPKLAQRRVRQRSSSSGFDNVSRTINRNFKSLQRSLANAFN